MRAPDERAWRVVALPEFDVTWGDAANRLSRAEAHRAAIERAVSRGPIKTSHPVGDKTTRVLRLIDPADRYEIWVYFRMIEDQRTCELGWVQLKEIQPDPPDTP